ncbi:hypothetical protein Tco_1082051 [Tanacetum coccineum]|uniref:Retrovirus-related Pol polyprotein from transposon TNT 1-94-like beta-barrel domain-containing protein n=1 Tax=Tanacetum coccineum TaxID=301880 RepID=A0ABQ5I0G3_9ASTR
MAQSSNEVNLNSSCYSDNAYSLDNDNMQLNTYLCEISLKIINKNKILKTKRDLLEKEILELNEKSKKLKRRKEIEIACKSCDELKSENVKLKETQVKFVKFDKSANTLREMLDTQKSSSCKIGLGFDNSKASTSRTKIMSFVGASAENATNGSTIRGHESTIPGSVCLRSCLEPDEWIKDSGFSKHMTSNKSLFSTYKAYDSGKVVFGSNLKGKIIGKGRLNFLLGLQIKQMDDRIFFSQSKYIKEMLKKFGLEDSKPTKTSMSTEIKLTKDDEADSVDRSKYRENPKTTHLEAVKRIFRVSLHLKIIKKFLRSLPASWSQVSLIMRTKPGVDTLSFDDLYNNLRVFESDVDKFNLEEMDLKWQVAMISMRLKKFYKNTGRKLQFDAKEPVGFDKTKEEPKALVTIDGDGVDWTGHAEDEQENFALMAYSNSGSNTEVEAQLVCHQQNQLVYEEKIRFMKIDLDDKTNVLTYHKKLLAEAVKEKEELKTKLENFQSSSKGLSKLLNSQMSAKDKSGLGYGDQIHEGVLSYENEVLESVFDSRSSDVEDSPWFQDSSCLMSCETGL